MALFPGAAAAQVLCFLSIMKVFIRTWKAESGLVFLGFLKVYGSSLSVLGLVGLTVVLLREASFLPLYICKHFLRVTESAGFSTESKNLGDNFHQAAESDVGHLDEVGFEDEYMPLSTLPSILLVMERAGGKAQVIHNLRSPGSPHFVPPSCSPAALLLHKDLIRGSKIPPPTVDHNLKPVRKGKCTLSLFHLLTISRLCFLYQLSDGSWSWG
ncbi:GRB2-associated-binding protein 2 [Sciurus carolinensis]|uniref:GRB2-associated-binding protein 2 n=1 Tax=Sciurus carolinensis TaxID=30640 RepID=A0AA41N9I7_SCICA|nr:GRB2-associated-binding protein 2 [Sciurus carolinensis]